jgi:hypothetical protein
MVNKYLFIRKILKANLTLNRLPIGTTNLKFRPCAKLEAYLSQTIRTRSMVLLCALLLENEENLAKHFITSCFHVSHSEPNFGCTGAFERALTSFHKMNHSIHDQEDYHLDALRLEIFSFLRFERLNLTLIILIFYHWSLAVNVAKSILRPHLKRTMDVFRKAIIEGYRILQWIGIMMSPYENVDNYYFHCCAQFWYIYIYIPTKTWFCMLLYCDDWFVTPCELWTEYDLLPYYI